MNKTPVSCADLNRLDIVTFLEGLGYRAERVSGFNYWYHSPLRTERTPSFKVNRRLNRWYDFGTGEGGSLVDFGVAYYRCSVSELLQRFAGPVLWGAAARQELPAPGEEHRLTVLCAGPITSLGLLRYLRSRRIPWELARTHLCEARFELSGKHYNALGFANRSGGYELRNHWFKGSSAPKDITLVCMGAGELSVFEGFFDFLSYQVLTVRGELPATDCLVLNSTALFERGLLLMDGYDKVHLFLDRDSTGLRLTQEILARGARFQDESPLYRGYKDLSEWVQNIGKGLHQGLDLF